MYYGGGNVTVINNRSQPLPYDFVSLTLKGRTDGFMLKGGDATTGKQTTMFDGPRPFETADGGGGSRQACARSVPRSWVGARRLFHFSLSLTASRVVLPQDPSTDRAAWWATVVVVAAASELAAVPPAPRSRSRNAQPVIRRKPGPVQLLLLLRISYQDRKHVMLIELRQAFMLYRDYHMFLLTLAGL